MNTHNRIGTLPEVVEPFGLTEELVALIGAGGGIIIVFILVGG